MKRYAAIAEFYDAEYAHLTMLHRDVPFLMKQIGTRPKRILELAVGTGRAAIPLAEAGHRVTGVDIGKDMLAIAERKRDFVGVSPRSLRLLHGDIRTYRSRERHDWVILLFNTLLAFPTVAELDAVMQTCHRHLVPGGRVCIDVFNPNLGLLAKPVIRGLDALTFRVESMGVNVSRVVDLRDVSREVREVSFRYSWREKGKVRRAVNRFAMTWIMPRELRYLLERNGFAGVRQYGDYDGGPVALTSPRCFTVARRKG